MVVGLLGRRADLVDEGQRFDKVSELPFAD